MVRRLLKLFCVAVAGLLVVAATVPWWLGAVLGFVGPRWLGLDFADYQRVGYSRFALTEVVVSQPEVTVQVDRIELDTPLLWLFERATGGTPGPVAAGAWSVAVAESAGEPTWESDFGWMKLEAMLSQVVTTLQDWVPVARAESGQVSWAGGRLVVGAARWDAGRLEVDRLAWGDRVATSLVAERVDAGWRLAATDPAELWSLVATAKGAEVAAEGRFWQQPWSASARFAETGWRPEVAELTAKDWVVPGERLGLAQAYADVSGLMRVRWERGRFNFSMEAAGEPVGDAPALQVELAGRGDAQEVVVERMSVQSPGVTATLDEPVRVSLEGRLLSDESKFQFEADLAKWPGLNARGSVSGSASVKPDDENRPSVRAKLSAKGLELAGWRVDAIKAEAGLQWPVVTVSQAEIVLPGGERLAASGEWNLQEKSLTDGKVAGRLTAVTLGPWVPEGMTFDAVEVKATAAGSWPELMHVGTATLTALGSEWSHPVDVSVDWQGRGLAADKVELVAKADGAELKAAGAVSRESATVKELILTEGDAVQWTLEQAATVAWSPALRVDGVKLSGAAGRLSVDGGAAGLVVSAQDVGVEWLRPWVLKVGPDWTAETLALKCAWADGPLSFVVEGRARLPLSAERAAVAAVRASADAQGVELQALQVSSGGQQVVSATGRLPVVIQPMGAERLVWLPDGELAINAKTEPQAKFWAWLAELSGVVIVDPQLDVAVSGSWRKPTGRAVLQVTSVSADPARWPRALPTVENLRAQLSGDAGGVLLEGLTMRVAGQDINAEGRLPVAPMEWGALLEEPSRLATAGGTLRIRIPDAEVAALARFMPEYLAPAGRLQLDVALRAEGGWSGFVRLQDAASRPLGPLGVVADVNANLELSGYELELRDTGALVGGQPVRLTGKIDFKDWRNPAPELQLRGENLPLVRRSGILIRTDLDLKVATNAAGKVGVSGVTTLRDSLLLADLRSLLPKGGVSGPARHPPYFAVETPPLNEWTLDVALRGEHFLKLRTPLFNGMMSARFRLTGTLGEPRLTGEASVDSGTIRLPFASFKVEQGVVRLTEVNPDEPRISLAATSRRYGYDLRMELSGTASAPELTFSSSPPLTSEQVLLMVMAGETPSDEISYSTSQRAVRVGAYLGQSLLGTFGLDPADSDRLTITIGEQISRQGRETYEVGYALSDNWTLTGEYNEFDDYNVGLKWRFYTSKPEPKENDAQP